MKNNKTKMAQLKEEKLLYILTSKVSAEISKNKGIYGDVIKIKVYTSKFDGTPEPGYIEIKDLIRFGDFESFATKYGLTLVAKKSNPDMYYELAWNVESYRKVLRKTLDDFKEIENSNVSSKCL